MSIQRPTTALTLSDLTDQALRVRAVEAAANYDATTLTQLTLAYMRAGSRRGARTSPHTLRAYETGVKTFVIWAETSGVQLLRPGLRDGGRYLAYLQEKSNGSRGRSGPLSAAAIANLLAGARALYRALRWAGATQAEPFADTSAPLDRTPAIEKNPPYADDLEQVLACCDTRLAALLLLCAHAGLRIGEALAVRVSDVQQGRLVVYGKGGKVRRVPLGRRVREALAVLSPADADGHYFVWTYSQATYRMKKACAEAGLPNYWRGFHAARKQSGTRLYKKVGDFTRVSLFLGHSSVDTTRRYVAVTDNDVAAEVEDF